jgi:hypothetical protein
MSLDEVERNYRVILCDIWGCIHDGVQLYPGAADRLGRWRGDGRTIVLITNAPRTAEAVAGQLVRLGLDERLWDGIATSGEAGIALLEKAPRPVGFIGTAADRAVLEGRGVQITDGDDFDALACTGLDEHRRKVGDYEDEIRPLAERGVLMHCLNPDRVVIRVAESPSRAPERSPTFISNLAGPSNGTASHIRRSIGTRCTLPAIRRLGRCWQSATPSTPICSEQPGWASTASSYRAEFTEASPSRKISDRCNGLGDWQPVAVVDGLA